MNAETILAGRAAAQRCGRAVLAGSLIVVVVTAMLPNLAQRDPLRHWLLDKIFAEVNGTVTASEASLGWFSTPAIRGLEFRDSNGRIAVSLPVVVGDIALWKLLWRPSELGRFRFERPHVHVWITDGTTNLEQVFGPIWRPDDDAPEHPADPGRGDRRLAVAAEIVDGRITVDSSGSSRDWVAGPVNVALSLRPPPPESDTSPQLLIEPGILLNRAELTPQMCDDVLKYVAPVLAGVTNTQGVVSLEWDQCRVPLDRPEATQLSGRLTIHAARVGPGPLVRELAALFQVRSSVTLAEESVVTFQVREGRVYHDGLEFGPPDFKLRTAGYVGLDHTLYLIADVPVPIPPRLAAEDRFVRALSQQRVRLPVGGTLTCPRVDARDLDRAGADLLWGTIRQSLGEVDSAAADGLLGEPSPRGSPTPDDLLRGLSVDGLSFFEQLLHGDRQQPPR